MKIEIPELSLVVLIGASGSGKSTFAAKHFLPTETISSDECRALVSDDANNQSATDDAFDLLRTIAEKRLSRGKLTVIDATNVQKHARAPLVELAKRQHCLTVAIVLDVPDSVYIARNKERPDRNFGPQVVARHRRDLKRSIRELQREGFRYKFVLDTEAKIDAALITRLPLWTDKRSNTGPFDIIGDVHGCASELEALLAKLGYSIVDRVEIFGDGASVYAHPDGRRAVFLGDLVDRGPRIVDTLRIVASMVEHGSAYCLPGNHDVKLMRKLAGRNVQISHGLDRTLAEIDSTPGDTRPSTTKAIHDFLDSLVSHYVLDGGKLVVAHAGMKQPMQGRSSGAVREFALYGETTGETDEFGLPIRYDWAADYRGRATVVYGHTPVPSPEWLNNTINIDTGCVFGGALTAFRYPEGELVDVPALATYAIPVRPINPALDGSLSAQQAHDSVLDLSDVLGRRLVETRLAGNVTVREENAAAALEIMTRFAIDPRWLIYLPPTMSPSETSQIPDLLEHPAEAMNYYRKEGIDRVVWETKHMGSRAILVVCADSQSGLKNFGVEGIGAAYTRTGRPLFPDAAMEEAVLDRCRNALAVSGTWETLDSDWLILDCELMPWSAKAQGLLRAQYAAVGAAGRLGLNAALGALAKVANPSDEISALREQMQDRLNYLNLYVDAYRRYCWPVSEIDDHKIAPFHILASGSSVHHDKPHQWHMELSAQLAEADSRLFLSTAWGVVDLNADGGVEAVSELWNEYTSAGGEGFVFKPYDLTAFGRRGPVQPAIKCRGREYLRIIYGPEYTDAKHLTQLKRRGLAAKRSLAFREFALGIEGLERFVRGEPLRRVHECAFAVLALESEPVDPRL